MRYLRVLSQDFGFGPRQGVEIPTLDFELGVGGGESESAQQFACRLLCTQRLECSSFLCSILSSLRRK